MNISHSKILQGLNAAAQGGTLTADVPGGVPAGAYRLCSINTSANHQPVIVPVAQHGSLDDCVYVSPPSTPPCSGATLTEFTCKFTATAGGAPAAGVPAPANPANPAEPTPSATAPATGGVSPLLVVVPLC